MLVSVNDPIKNKMPEEKKKKTETYLVILCTGGPTKPVCRSS